MKYSAYFLWSLFLLSCGKGKEESKDPILISRSAELFLNSAKFHADLLNSSTENFEYGFLYSHRVNVPLRGAADVDRVAGNTSSALK